MMRLFTAINFNSVTKDALEEAAESLRRFGVKGNFTKRENYHLTLVFLGELPESRVHAIQRRMEAAVFSMKPFNLCFRGIGTFKGGIVWAGVVPCPPLTKLWKKVSNGLREEGFSFRDEGYSPHLTLCREATWQGKLPETALDAEISVNAITLMKSERINGKLTYTSIYEARIGEKNET